MRKIQTTLLITVLAGTAVFIIACGAGPSDQQQPTRARAQSSAPPTPTRPATGAWGREFDAETNFPNHNLTLAGTSWVQLDHRELDDTTIVVGYEPMAPGFTPAQAMNDYQEQFATPIGSGNSDRGTIDSEVLGTIEWSRRTFEREGIAMTQLALFAKHPITNSILITRSEFPGERSDIDRELAEAVRASEIIGPGL